MTEQRPGLEIVVGLDDSPSARAALSWAADYVRAVGARLRALHVFSEQMAAMGWTPGVPGMAYLAERPSTAETTARMRVVFGQVHPDPGWVLDSRRSSGATAGRTVPTGHGARSGHPRPCRVRATAGRFGQSPLSEPRRMSRRGCAGGADSSPGQPGGPRAAPPRPLPSRRDESGLRSTPLDDSTTQGGER